MSFLPTTDSSGLDKARPAASTALINAFYYATDTEKLYRCVSATAWTVVGIGRDKATMGVWSDGIYYSGVNTTGPIGAVGSFSWACSFYVESLPGTAGGLIWTNAKSDLTLGWSIGASATASNKMRMLMAGLTPSGGAANVVELPGIALAVGVHTLAVCFKAGATSIHYSYDGSIQTAIVVAGTFVPVTSAATHYIGRWAAGGFAGAWASIAWLQAYNADLSDGDLNTLSGSPSTYIPPSISTAPVFNWQARWYDDGASVSDPVGSQSGRLMGTAPSSIVKTLR